MGEPKVFYIPAAFIHCRKKLQQKQLSQAIRLDAAAPD
jgi:hypothetical protein